MRPESADFLQSLLEAPSPSGFEQSVQQIVRSYAEPWADEIRTDVHGNVIAVKNPDAQPRVMLAGHCDQIGLMVQHITDEGFLHFSAIGGIDVPLLPGSRIYIHTAQGPVLGVIGRKAIHLLEADERKKAAAKISKLWIDIGTKDKEAAEKLVQVGDPTTFELGLHQLSGDLVAGPGFDDKVGAFVVMEVLRLLADRRLDCALYCVSTVQEELGLRGARTSSFGIEPHVGIAVDVTHASDYPEADKAVTGEIKLGAGPTIARGANINPVLHRLLVDTARECDLAYQPEPAPRATGTDANVMQIARAGAAAALISIPNRYMHTPVEVVSLSDVEVAGRLIAETVARIDDQIDFTPV